MTSLPVCRAAELTATAVTPRWLIEGLWGEEAVGLIGGEPKCCKTFLALDLAVSIASGAPCLRRFPVKRTGRVLLYGAEDAPIAIGQRLFGIARAAGVEFATLDVHVITAPALRLDQADDCVQLNETVKQLRPILLILDPFVRLHRVDENAVAEVAPILGYLRGLQRTYRTAVLLVHHSRKGAAHLRAGQALRGSSELHAWGDSYLYLRRRGRRLLLAAEHRSAPGTDDVALELKNDGDALALHVIDPSEEPPPARHDPASPQERIHHAVATATQPLSVRQLRAICGIRTATLCDTLAAMTRDGRLVKSSAGYHLPAPQS